MRTLIIGFVIFLSTSMGANAAIISIADSGIGPNIQEDTRALGFARSVGQTFIVPGPTTENVLTDFTFYIDAGSSPADLDYAAYLYEFDTGTESPTGAALFDSGAQSLSANGALSFSGFSITLNPALTYIAFLSTSGLQDQDNNSTFLDANAGDVYTGGAAYRYTGSLTDMSSFTGDAANWNIISPGWDMRFDATMVLVPEPSTALLLGLGLLGLASRRR